MLEPKESARKSDGAWVFRGASLRAALPYAGMGLLLVVALVVVGDEIGHHIRAIESWIASMGPWGVLAFTALFVLATTLLLPETVLAIMAGALFGLEEGLAAVVAGGMAAATLQFFLSRRALRATIQKTLGAKPSLAAIQQAVTRNEVRLQVLLRLTPLNPATLSFLFGAAGVRFSGFLLAGASVASIVLGVAAQNTLGNAVAGLALLVYRPFRVGDRLQVQAPGGPETGIVESVTLGYTVLQTFDNRRVVLPNSLAGTQTTVNLTSVDPRVMTAVTVGISYTSDVARAREILLDISSAHPDVIEPVDCPVVELGSSSVLLRVRAWCHDPLAAHRFEYGLYEQAKERFAEAGIEIPYPYQNVILTDRRG